MSILDRCGPISDQFGYRMAQLGRSLVIKNNTLLPRPVKTAQMHVCSIAVYLLFIESQAACYLSMEAVPRAATAMTGEIAPSATTAVASAPPSYNQQHQQQQTPQSASDIGTLGTTFSMCEDPALDDCTALQIQEHSQTQRYDYHVAYHPSYRVPVLYLRGKDAGWCRSQVVLQLGRDRDAVILQVCDSLTQISVFQFRVADGMQLKD